LQAYFGGGYTAELWGYGIQVLAGLAPSNQAVGSPSLLFGAVNFVDAMFPNKIQIWKDFFLRCSEKIFKIS